MSEITLTVPDIGDFEDVEIIEILVAEGDTIPIEAPLITLETDKATMDIPASDAGIIGKLLVKVGDRVNQGDPIATLEPGSPVAAAVPSAQNQPEPSQTAAEKTPAENRPPSPTPEPEPDAPVPRPSPTGNIDEVSFSKAHASPSVRKFARELGVDLGQVNGSGRKNRITRIDVKDFVKRTITTGSNNGGLRVALMPEIDFNTFGDTDTQPLTKINKLTGTVSAPQLGPLSRT